MTVRGVARLAVYCVATTAVGAALFIREALRDIGRAVRLPGELRRQPTIDDLLAGFGRHDEA